MKGLLSHEGTRLMNTGCDVRIAGLPLGQEDERPLALQQRWPLKSVQFHLSAQALKMSCLINFDSLTSSRPNQ